MCVCICMCSLAYYVMYRCVCVLLAHIYIYYIVCFYLYSIPCFIYTCSIKMGKIYIYIQVHTYTQIDSISLLVSCYFCSPLCLGYPYCGI